jgi:hypothetical protein
MKIKQTSTDKIRGKLIKYRIGDCLAIRLNNGNYLGAIMTGKFNSYYNLTLIEFYENLKPTLQDFHKSRFFGTRFGSIENIQYGVEQRMIKCKYVDNSADIESIGNLKLISNFISAGYAYLDNIDQILKFYTSELPTRIEKTKNAFKFPEIGFVSQNLIEMIYISE